MLFGQLGCGRVEEWYSPSPCSYKLIVEEKSSEVKNFIPSELKCDLIIIDII